MPRLQDAAAAIHRSADDARRELFNEYQNRIETNAALSRSLVSYQANKRRPYYRWFKYKEGFSAAFVEYILHWAGKQVRHVFDPFAGSGAALFAARHSGLESTGIELLPVGDCAIRARLAAERISRDAFRAQIERFRAARRQLKGDQSAAMQHMTITRDAFPPKTERDLTAFRTYVREKVTDESIRCLFDFACMSILEAISFTRKDGQYLRWDYRSGRRLKGKRFDKGKIPDFQDTIDRQLRIMLDDMTQRDLFSKTGPGKGEINLWRGSCLSVLPEMEDEQFDLVITSPPYCNRYDYTRTYALELAYLGVDEDELKNLRQSLLSCTVENRTKTRELRDHYDKASHPELLDRAVSAFSAQAALQELLRVLEEKRDAGLLNNTNVPRMVTNYFLESAVTIFELHRLMRPGGRVVMVNDNVQYAGEEVPVDLILSDIARMAGFAVEHIWTLGRGKGNSSQQMGAHGRNELRKCAYVWRRA